jgi:hypothetical protein
VRHHIPGPGAVMARWCSGGDSHTPGLCFLRDFRGEKNASLALGNLRKMRLAQTACRSIARGLATRPSTLRAGGAVQARFLSRKPLSAASAASPPAVAPAGSGSEGEDEEGLEEGDELFSSREEPFRESSRPPSPGAAIVTGREIRATRGGAKSW